MKIQILQQYNVIRTNYADDRINAKLEYIRRKFKNEYAYVHLEEEISKVEISLSRNAKHNKPYLDENGVEYRYAMINVGEGYFLLYHIDGNTVIVDDCLHRREQKDIL